MKLRAHHLLCTRAFKGYGYSPQFIKNMYNIISLIKTEKNISLITRCDAICTECPKNKDECCILEDKVLEFDIKTLKYLNLEQKKNIHTLKSNKN